MLKYSASELVKLLGLTKHPEGGYYKETYRSGCTPKNEGSKLCGQHWVWTLSDIVYLWHGGATVKYHVLDPTTGDYECILLGPNLEEGNVMQMSIKGGYYKCAEVVCAEDTPDYALLAEAVAPGFDYRDLGFVTEDNLRAVAPPNKLEFFKNFLHP